MTVSRGSGRLAWAVLIAVLLVPVWWGGDGRFPWDNSIAPAAVLKALAARFRPGFFTTYGPVPYYLTAIPYLGVLGFAKIVGELSTPSSVYPWGFRHPELMMTLLTTVAHLVTMVLGLGLVWIATHRPPAGPATARRWLAPLLLLGSPIFMFYARTSNVDVHYLFWLWLGVVLVERGHGSWRALAGATAAATLAVCSKEQSAPVAGVIVLGAMWASSRPRSDGKRVRVLPVLGLMAVAAATYGLAWRLPWNLEGWRVHHEFLFADATYERTFPATLTGFSALAGTATLQSLAVLGPALVVGVILAVVMRSSWRGLGLRALASVAYLVGFIGAIGYTYERFLLPILLVAVPVGVRGWDAALTRIGVRRTWSTVLTGALLLAASAGGPALSWVLLNDPRYAAEQWIRERVPPTATLEVAGNPHYQPRLPAGRATIRTMVDSLGMAPRGPIGDVVLVSSIDAWAFTKDLEARVAWWEPLHARSGGVAYSRRVVFPRSRLYVLTPGIEVPIITAYLRDGVNLRGAD